MSKSFVTVNGDVINVGDTVRTRDRGPVIINSVSRVNGLTYSCTLYSEAFGNQAFFYRDGWWSGEGEPESWDLLSVIKAAKPRQTITKFMKYLNEQKYA